MRVDVNLALDIFSISQILRRGLEHLEFIDNVETRSYGNLFQVRDTLSKQTIDTLSSSNLGADAGRYLTQLQQDAS